MWQQDKGTKIYPKFNYKIFEQSKLPLNIFYPGLFVKCPKILVV